MKNTYLDAALQRIGNTELLINIVSRRVRQLATGQRPMTQVEPRMEAMDIALKEISEGKIGYEILSAPDTATGAVESILE